MRYLIPMLLLCAAPCWAAGVPMLRVQGKDIVESNARAVSMRGINLGSWLMMETWIPSFGLTPEGHLKKLAMEAGIADQYSAALKRAGEFNDDVMTYQGYTDKVRKRLAALVTAKQADTFWALVEKEPPIVDAVTLDRVLRQRFGNDGATEVWEVFHQTWMTEEDFRRAKEMGFNFVRIPFWYRWFEDDDKPYVFKDYGFQYLDKGIGWAKANGLYVLLDLHGAPGGQSPWEHTGQMSRGELFKNEEFQKRTYALWAAIAKRYKDDPTVFMYGCLNEPFSAKDAADWARVHDGIYKAIRSVDANHIIMMEDGYKTEDPPYNKKGFFPVPAEKGWDNVAYSIHFYQTGKLAAHEKKCKEVLRVAAMEQGRCGVPIYIGEFNSITDTPDAVKAMGMYCTAFNEHGLHWSPWTLKYVGGDKTLWGVYQYDGKWDMPDIHRDSKEALLSKIARYAAANFKPYEPYATELRRCLKQPVVSAAE